MNKKIVLAYIIGFISAISITVFANILYNAKDIEYTSSNEEWQVTNVEDAINSLYGSNNELKDNLEDANKMISDLSKFTTFDVLYDATVADPNNKYYTKSYTYTQTNVNSGYRLLVVLVSSSGGNNYSWEASDATIPNTIVKKDLPTPNITSLLNTGSLHATNRLFFAIPPTAAGTVYSAQFRGSCRITIIGIK